MLRKKTKERKRPNLQRGGRVSRYTDYYKSEPKDVVVNTTKEPFNRQAPVKRNTSKHIRSIPTYIALLLIVVSVIWASSLSGKTAVVTGNYAGLHSQDHYEKIANELMTKDIFNKSKISFDTRTYKENLLKAIPELQDVVVSVPLVGRNIVLGLTFVKPAYLYTVNNINYVLGSDGVILSEASGVSSEVLGPLKRLTDVAPLKVSIGQTVLLSSDILFINKVFNDLEGAKKEIKSVTLPEGAGELYVSLVNEPYSIKFSLLGDAQTQIGAYIATIEKLQAEGTMPSEYIDVRLGERVFVK